MPAIGYQEIFLFVLQIPQKVTTETCFLNSTTKKPTGQFETKSFISNICIVLFHCCDYIYIYIDLQTPRHSPCKHTMLEPRALTRAPLRYVSCVHDAGDKERTVHFIHGTISQRSSQKTSNCFHGFPSDRTDRQPSGSSSDSAVLNEAQGLPTSKRLD